MPRCGAGAAVTADKRPRRRLTTWGAAHAGPRAAHNAKAARARPPRSLTSGTAGRRAPGRCAPQISPPRRGGRGADRGFQIGASSDVKNVPETGFGW
jgi:hypothetical protein